MSGHSKWATIKHAKGAADAKRGKLFSRLSKNISMAVKQGGSDDPAFNPQLRLFVDKAKSSNMPKAKIQNAIDKGAGRVEGVSYEEVVYEGFGPNKVAVMIECVTDNRNRTNSEIRKLITRSGGTLGSQGSVGYFFDRKGVILINVPEGMDIEELQLELMDYEVEDVVIQSINVLKIITKDVNTHAVIQDLKKDNYEVVEGDIAMIPNMFVELDSKQYEVFMKFFDLIDDYEDVQKIYHNAKKK